MAKHLYIDLTQMAPASISAAEYQEDETIVVRGHQTETDRVVSEKSKLDGAKKQLEDAREALEPLAKEFRKQAELDGKFASKVQFQGSETRAFFTFTNAFSNLDIGMKEQLTTVLGPDVTEHLFKPVERTALNDAKAAELRDLIKAAGKDPADYLVTDKSLRFDQEFRRKRFDLRDQLNEDQNTALDLVAEAAASRPSLTTK